MGRGKNNRHRKKGGSMEPRPPRNPEAEKEKEKEKEKEQEQEEKKPCKPEQEPEGPPRNPEVEKKKEKEKEPDPEQEEKKEEVRKGPRFPPPVCWKPEGWSKEAPPSPSESSLLDTLLHHHYRALTLICKDKDDDKVSWEVRGMVLAGYAYGLKETPFGNIIANAQWYNQMFPLPSSSKVQIRMISCKVMLRLACRSFNALVAFMEVYAPDLTRQQILEYLNNTDGYLNRAMELARTRGIAHDDRKDDAFRAAVSVARLPNEIARQAQLDMFLVGHESAQPLHGHGHDSAATLEPAASRLSLSRGAKSGLNNHISYFRIMEENQLLHVVRMALEKLGNHYELKMLCGKNLFPSFYGDEFYHVNFFASPGGSNVPTLFFAEVSAELRDVNDVTLCCPVTRRGRKISDGASFAGACFACEYDGMKLIHPVDVEFNGRLNYSMSGSPVLDERFRKVPTHFICPLREDYLFFEADRHPEVAKFLEATYSHLSDAKIESCFITIS